MKLKITPARISILALGAVAAVVAQELVRSDTKTPSATPNPKLKRTSANSPILPNSAVAMAQPESLFASAAPPTLTPNPELPAPNPIATTAPAAPAAPPPPIQIQEPPKPSVSTALRVVDVNQLPIDSIVSDTLQAPPAPPKATAPAPTPNNKAPKANTANTAKDIQGHRAQASINALMRRGIMQSYGDGSFRPNAPISDEQFQTVVKQASKRSASVSSTLRRPKDIVTRADAAAYVHRQLLRAAAIEGAAPATSAPLPKVASAPVSQTVAQSQPMPPTTTPLSFDADTPTTSADSDSYTLGSGDRVRVDIFNVPEYGKEYQVLVNGTLNLHRAGSISVAGLTIRQAQNAIAAKYARLLKNPTVDLSLLTARPLNVAIAGEVGKPGTYSLAFGENGKFPTVTKLLREAGGMNRSANPRQVIVRRPQRTGADQQIRLDLWELFQTGNIRQDLTLRDGDSIFIPAAGTVNLAEATQLADANFSVSSTQPVSVAIVGEVARPGPYTIKDKTATVSQAIRDAGGIKQLANLKDVKVRRTTRAGETQTIKVDLWNLLKTGDLNQDLVLQQGDTIEIPTALALDPRDAAALGTASFAPGAVKITVVGEVTKPGQVDVPMNTTLNQALLAAGGFTRQANRRRVELVRLNPNGSVTRKDVSIDLSKGIDENGNPLLQNGDVLVIDRSGTAKVGDTLNNVLGPVFQLLPFRFLFGL